MRRRLRALPKGCTFRRVPRVRRGCRRQDVVGAVWATANSAKAGADVRKAVLSRIEGGVLLSAHKRAREDRCTKDGKKRWKDLGDALHCHVNIMRLRSH